MTESSAKPIRLTILGKEYRLACPHGEEEALQCSAAYLEKEMLVIRSQSKSFGSNNDMLLMVAALNITHKLLTEEASNRQYQASVIDNVAVLQEKIETALSQTI